MGKAGRPLDLRGVLRRGRRGYLLHAGRAVTPRSIISYARAGSCRSDPMRKAYKGSTFFLPFFCRYCGNPRLRFLSEMADTATEAQKVRGGPVGESKHEA